LGRARAPQNEMAVDPTAPSPGVPAALEPEMPLGSSERQGEGGVGPYKLAVRRLRRNKTALAFGAIFVFIVILCLCAPLYADHVAHTTPSANHITDTIKVRGHERDVVAPGGIPTGPTFFKNQPEKVGHPRSSPQVGSACLRRSTRRERI